MNLSDAVKLPEKNGYPKGLPEAIGSLLMGKTKEEMAQGFKDFKDMKNVERQRDIGFNYCLDQISPLPLDPTKLVVIDREEMLKVLQDTHWHIVNSVLVDALIETQSQWLKEKKV